MKQTGVTRRIDELGRIVIPKEIRKKLKINEGENIEIYIDEEEKIILKKYSNVKNIIFGSTWVEDKETSKTTTVACQGIRTVDNMKQYANNAVKNKAWLVFMSHAYYSPSGKYYFDEYCEDTIIEFCNDVNAMGNVKFVTLTEGYKLMN